MGSFLNVCLVRWKNGGQIIFPPSHCPKCKHPLEWFDNIPLISFLVLGAKCRYCHKSISWQYPIVELLTALLFLTSFYRFSTNALHLFMSYSFVTFLVLLAVNDWNWRLLPHLFNNLFILAGFSFGLFLSPINITFQLAVGFFSLGSIMYLFFLIYPKGLGGGDVKMVAGLAVWLGVANSICMLIIAFGLGSLFFGLMLALGKVNRKSMVPLGPFLAFASLVLWFFPGVINRMGLNL